VPKAAAVGESSQTTQTDPAIAAARAAFSNAIGRGDTKAAAAVYSVAASLVAPSADLIEGRDSIEAFWRAGIDSGVAAVELEAVRVEHQDRLAYELGRYVFRIRSGPQGLAVDRGRYVLVLERRNDGSWCRTVEMFSPEAPSAALAANRRPGDQ
jgi:ketosteroid isomerase-like protein